MINRIFYPLIILIIPLVGTILFDQIDWGILDFLVMGIILLIVGIALNVVSQKIKNSRKKFFYNLVIMLIFFLIWAELAVGIF
jgi:heme O synthase-like polyprenyltransferase